MRREPRDPFDVLRDEIEAEERAINARVIWSLRVAVFLAVLAVLVVLVLLPMGVAHAQVGQIPPVAHRYRAELVRAAHAHFGLSAPVPVFAAQVHQESAWRHDAVSRVGAQGMAQFMPATARWWCDLHRMSPAECQPSNPAWALRSLVGYNRWIWERVPVSHPGDRMWATLRAYNGGLGHWQAEARNATDNTRASIDAACGTARRHVSHCRENLGYPDRIMRVLQPRYAGWGPGLEVSP
ncbi:MAG TPA: transglycosylase SLT domain-containing protein [Rhodocyclaceae bacterium]|nr:transglycosylase SLT domain-containing protein [Rhodocyclaceae bacterium]